MHRRFLAAQKIQATARGFMVRARVLQRLVRAHTAAVRIQKTWNGHVLRAQIWGAVLQGRCRKIQSWARGVMVRQRKRDLVRRVTFVQNYFRFHLRRTTAERRDVLRQLTQDRKSKVTAIQSQYRSHAASGQMIANRERPELSDAGICARYNADMDPETLAAIRREHLQTFQQSQGVLAGVFLRVESRWQRAAATIQRSVRTRLLGMDASEARTKPRAVAPLRGTHGSGTRVGIVPRPAAPKTDSRPARLSGRPVADYILEP